MLVSFYGWTGTKGGPLVPFRTTTFPNYEDVVPIRTYHEDLISKHVRSHIRECLYDQFLGDAGGLGSGGISLKLVVVVSLLSKTILQLVTSLTRSIHLGAN